MTAAKPIGFSQSVLPKHRLGVVLQTGPRWDRGGIGWEPNLPPVELVVVAAILELLSDPLADHYAPITRINCHVALVELRNDYLRPARTKRATRIGILLVRIMKRILALLAASLFSLQMAQAWG